MPTHCFWKGAGSLVCVSLFLLSQGEEVPVPLSGSPTMLPVVAWSHDGNCGCSLRSWSRRKLDLLSIFQVLWVFSWCPSLPQTNGFRFSKPCPLGVLLSLLQCLAVLLVSVPELWLCWGECWISSSTSIFTPNHSLLHHLCLICKYYSMHIVLRTCWLGYF